MLCLALNEASLLPFLLSPISFLEDLVKVIRSTPYVLVDLHIIDGISLQNALKLLGERS